MAAPTPYLEANPPRQTQFRARRSKVTGLIVVHTAESAPDVSGADGGALAVAKFIRGRSDYGSYHVVCDSDDRVQLVDFAKAAYGDGTGSNEFAIHVSGATQAAAWGRLPRAWVDGCVRQMVAAAADAARWLRAKHGITVPARRVTRDQSNRGAAGFISHGERAPGSRSDPGSGFPWDAFLKEYARLMAAGTAQPSPSQQGRVRVPVAHASMQESDTPKQQASDVDRIFDRQLGRGTWWLTFTESGPETKLHELWREKCREHGWKVVIGRSTGIAVDGRRVAKGSWKSGWEKAVDTAKVVGPGHDLGVTWARWRNPTIGHVGNLAAHAATKGDPSRSPAPNLGANRQLMEVVGRLGREFGAGPGLAFYHGDQNMNDREVDTFLGRAGFLSLGDELKRWPGTLGLPIDVAASWRADKRVTAAGWRAVPDKKFHLHTDHLLAEGGFWVERLAS